MTVWLVIGSYEDAGLDQPEGVFSTAELAETCAAKLEMAGKYDIVEVLVYGIDDAAD